MVALITQILKRLHRFSDQVFNLCNHNFIYVDMTILRILIMVICFISIISIISSPAYAIFELRADNNVIDFGFMNIAEVKEVRGKGTYHNEITCRSDSGNTWYLKIHLIGPLKSGSDSIPFNNFAWRVISVINGNGIIYNEDVFRSFSDFPELVYTSGPNDSKGDEVKIRFDYRLSIPRNQPPGNYRTIVRYTMTELF